MAFINKPICALFALLVWPMACGQADGQPHAGSGGATHAGSGGRNASLGGDGGGSGEATGGGVGDASGGEPSGGVSSIAPLGTGGVSYSAGGTSAAGGGSGGRSEQSMGGTAPVKQSFCVRLDAEYVYLSDRVTRTYALSLIADCRVSGLYNSLSVSERIARVNALNLYSQALWGCADSPPTDFALALGATKLSRAESELLISLYLDAVSLRVGYSAQERASLLHDLQLLATSAITVDSDALLHDECAPVGGGGNAGAGGAGGHGGASSDPGSDHGGVGGAP